MKKFKGFNSSRFNSSRFNSSRFNSSRFKGSPLSVLPHGSLREPQAPPFESLRHRDRSPISLHVQSPLAEVLACLELVEGKPACRVGNRLPLPSSNPCRDSAECFVCRSIRDGGFEEGLEDRVIASLRAHPCYRGEGNSLDRSARQRWVGHGCLVRPDVDLQ